MEQRLHDKKDLERNVIVLDIDGVLNDDFYKKIFRL